METAKKQRLAKLMDNLILLTVQDICIITGWAEKTVVNVMKYDKEFPVIKIGKENLVEFDSFKKYLSTRRDLRGKLEENKS